MKAGNLCYDHNMIAAKDMLCSSLLPVDEKEKVEHILRAALEAVDPAEAVRRAVLRDEDTLRVGKNSYRLSQYERVFIISVGKAGVKMASAIHEILAEKITAGVVICKHRQDELLENLDPAKWKLIQGGHPIPDENSLLAGRYLLQMLQNLTERDLVFCLISGGGSALMTAPIEPVKLEDIQQTTKKLLACGASIQEINTIRKHLDRVKGGGLARQAYPAQVMTLILSDVIGNPLDVIASGPTVADSSTFADAVDILNHYQIESKLPASVLHVLKAGEAGSLVETVKIGEPCLKNAQHLVVGSNQQAADAAVLQARREGFHSELLSTYLDGEARDTGKFLANVLKQMAYQNQPLPRPACLVAGGETTVTLKGKGEGGRNLELALGSVLPIAGLEKVALVTLATDGEDGTAPCAGGIVTGETAVAAYQIGLKPQAYLDENNSYGFFAQLGEWVNTGSTGTNVNDLVFLFTF